MILFLIQGLDGIKSVIERVQVSHQALQPQRYILPAIVTKVEGELLTTLQKNKLVEFTTLVNHFSGMATLSLLKEMHSQVFSGLHKRLFED